MMPTCLVFWDRMSNWFGLFGDNEDSDNQISSNPTILRKAQGTVITNQPNSSNLTKINQNSWNEIRISAAETSTQTAEEGETSVYRVPMVDSSTQWSDLNDIDLELEKT